MGEGAERMKRSRIWLSLAMSVTLGLAACAADQGTPDATDGAGDGEELDAVSLQLQWAPQAQFAGYFAAQELGYYEDEGLDVTLVPGGPDVIPQQAGSAADGPEFTISWVPKVLEAREQESDLVNIAQIFQRSGTLSVAWADSGITEPADFAGKKVGVWDFGNEFEVTAAATAAGLERDVDYEVVIQPFDMLLFLSRDIDVAEAMIYNEYAQVLETVNPDTGELYQPEDMNVIDYNEVGTAMLQDAIFARAAWLAEEGNEDIAERFLRASFRGWIHCRENPDECIQFTVDAGSTLGAGHQAWMMNEINPLIWPSPEGIGIMDAEQWQQTVDISLESGIISEEPPEDAYRTDLAEAALEGIEEDTAGEGFSKGTVEVTEGGE
jgi:NitT/TauT family transport system substrate-binding protein